MQISDIKTNRIIPFEIEDIKLIRLFSFFLHKSPTIDSNTAAMIEVERLERNWERFISEFSKDNEANVNRRSKGFICKYKDNSERDYECVLRHMRNAIAHSNVYMNNAGNRKYLIFEDFNKTKNQSSIMLLSQADLSNLKREIMR